MFTAVKMFRPTADPKSSVARERMSVNSSQFVLLHDKLISGTHPTAPLTVSPQSPKQAENGIRDRCGDIPRYVDGFEDASTQRLAHDEQLEDELHGAVLSVAYRSSPHATHASMQS